MSAQVPGYLPAGADPYPVFPAEEPRAASEWHPDGDMLGALDDVPDSLPQRRRAPKFTPRPAPTGERVPVPGDLGAPDFGQMAIDQAVLKRTLEGLRNLDVRGRGRAHPAPAPMTAVPDDDGGWLKELLGKALDSYAGSLLAIPDVCADCTKRPCGRHAGFEARADLCLRAAELVGKSGSSLLAVLALLGTEWRAA